MFGFYLLIKESNGILYNRFVSPKLDLYTIWWLLLFITISSSYKLSYCKVSMRKFQLWKCKDGDGEFFKWYCHYCKSRPFEIGVFWSYKIMDRYRLYEPYIAAGDWHCQDIFFGDQINKSRLMLNFHMNFFEI